MNDPGTLDRIVERVLYDGYILYPYRASSKKNAERLTFGRVYPGDYSQAQCDAEPCTMQTECLVRGASDDAAVEISLRFLHPMSRDILVRGQSTEDFRPVAEHRSGGKRYAPWLECVEQDVAVERLALRGSGTREECAVFHFPPSEGLESVEENVRILRKQAALDGEVAVTADRLDEAVWKIRVNIANLTEVLEGSLEKQDEIVMRTFASTHIILRACDAEFLSLLDPPPEYAATAATCRNVGTWPVLMGDASARECDTMLSAPVILDDYPRISPESPGNFFDGAGIDEIRTNRGKISERKREQLPHNC